MELITALGDRLHRLLAEGGCLQAHRELGTLSKRAGDTHFPTMRIDDPLDDGQAQTGVARTTPPGAIATIEALEHMREVLRRDSLPSIGDA